MAYEKQHQDDSYLKWLKMSKRKDTFDEFVRFLQTIMGWTYQYSYYYAKVNFKSNTK